MKIRTGLFAVLLGAASGILAADPPQDPLSLLDQRAAATRDATAPQVFLSPSTRSARASALEAAIQKGLTYLEGAQHDNGSFDRLQSVRMLNVDPKMLAEQHSPGHDPDPILMSDGPDKDAAESDTEQIADTALSAETMMLAVNSGRRPELSSQCLKAVDFLCKQIKMWEGDTIYIQKRTLDPLHDPHPLMDQHHSLTRDVRFYDSTVDTFFALRFLCEARGRIDDAARKARVQAAIDILLHKIVKCQDTHGTWPDEGDPASLLPIHRNLSKWNDWPQVPAYDDHTTNLITHCVALSAINIAARNGVPIPAEVRYRAENYLLHALELEKLHGVTTEGSIRIIAVVAAESEVYETCHALLEKGLADHAQGKNVSIDELNALKTHATQAKADLKALVPYMMEMGEIPTHGPALDALPEAIHGMEIVSTDEDENGVFLRSSYRAFLRRQLDDGSIAATPPELLARDDCTYGTATTLRLMMMAANMKENPTADTQP